MLEARYRFRFIVLCFCISFSSCVCDPHGVMFAVFSRKLVAMSQGLDKLADSLGHLIMTEDGAITSVCYSLILILTFDSLVCVG
jgi:hypothetical protein